MDLARPSVVRVATGQGVGSGFIVDSDGYIVTNNHVIESAPNSIEVTLADGSVHGANLVGTDPDSDLAVLNVETASDLPSLELASLDTVDVGEDVVAIGYALDLSQGHGEPSVTRGIVSAKNRRIPVGNILGTVQTDAAINHGNSGGPLIDYAGQVVGVNTALAPDESTGGVAQNIGFAVGSDTVRAVYDEIREKGRVERGFLGISDFAALRPAEAQALNIPEDQQGILVPPDGVMPDGPTDQAGMRGQDVITSIDGEDVGNQSELWVAMIRHDPGDTVDVEVYRNGEEQTLSVTLGEPPPQP
ncbi:MAG: trypsin-like peptidase domain-containing protein [Dehalococcoidia bacterium]|nr:trypsin-like peptidase domain-containing protein [Dehalococcoidia bacterium]